jgi:site-specific recombinase XerD
VKLLDEYKEELRRLRYSENTQQVYSDAFAQFLYHHKDRDYRYITKREIEAYLLYMVDVKKIGYSTQNTSINAIKFYYEKMLHQPRKTYYINRPRRKQRFKVLLENEEINKLFYVCTNIKHKCIMGLLYGCGLRIGEVINLKIKDIDINRMGVMIWGAKGDEDREVPLPEKLLIRIDEYLNEYEPKEYLFNGQENFKGEFKLQYSETSIRLFLLDYAKKAGITKRVHPHLLRNNFITEHIEEDTNIVKLQKISGHKTPKTTSGYHRFRRDALRETKSPIDNKDF